MSEKLFNDFNRTQYEDWKLLAEKALKGAPFERKMFTGTYEGIALKPIYLAEDAGALADTMPGSMPFIRSGRADGYIKEPWLIAQECDSFNAADANSTLKNELERGLQAVHLRLDSASALCTSPDTAEDPQIGDKGLSLCSKDDLLETLKDIPFDKIPLRVHTGCSAVGFLALLAAAAGERGVKISELKGCAGADPLGMLAEKGRLPASAGDLFSHMVLAARWAADNAPGLRTVIIDTSCYHNAGANAVQELALAAAAAAEYLRELTKGGLSFAVACGQIQFVFSVGANMFMEIAKLRAFRLIWSQICRAYGCEGRECAPNIHARTSFFTKTVYDPYVNLLRATTESFAGVVGGADSMHVGTFDETVRRGDQFSRRIARNIQIMLQNECDLTQPIDPAGGSWYVEALTQELAEKGWELFRKFEGEGGLLRCLLNGTVQKEIDAVFSKRQANLAKRSNIAVGTNMYANLAEKPLTPEEPVPYAKRRSDVKNYKNGRDGKVISSALAKLKTLDLSSGAGFKDITAAAGAGCTADEIFLALVNGGETVKAEAVPVRRNTQIFEALRQATEEYVKKTGKNIRVFSANIGPVPQHKARADFSRGFFEAGAFEVLGNGGFDTAEEAAKAAAEEKPDAVVICSSDEVYPDVVPTLAGLLKERLPEAVVYLAGRPSDDQREVYGNAGVDGYIYMGADCRGILSELQKRKGLI